MKLPRRSFLHLAAGAATLPAVSRRPRPILRNQLRSWCHAPQAVQWICVHALWPSICGRRSVSPSSLKMLAVLPAVLAPAGSLALHRTVAGTAGVGSPQHVFGILLQNATSTRVNFVHYRGGAPAMQDLVAGQIDLIVGDLTTSLPQVRAGSVKPYAFTGRSRSAAAPEVPTADEAGLPGFYTSVWSAIWAPKGTPKHVIGKLNAAIVEALSAPATRQRLVDLGDQVVPREEQAPERLRALHEAEIDKWWPIIKAANIKAE